MGVESDCLAANHTSFLSRPHSPDIPIAETADGNTHSHKSKSNCDVISGTQMERLSRDEEHFSRKNVSGDEKFDLKGFAYDPFSRQPAQPHPSIRLPQPAQPHPLHTSHFLPHPSIRLPQFPGDDFRLDSFVCPSNFPQHFPYPYRPPPVPAGQAQAIPVRRDLNNMRQLPFMRPVHARFDDLRAQTPNLTTHTFHSTEMFPSNENTVLQDLSNGISPPSFFDNADISIHRNEGFPLIDGEINVGCKDDVARNNVYCRKIHHSVPKQPCQNHDRMKHSVILDDGIHRDIGTQGNPHPHYPTLSTERPENGHQLLGLTTSDAILTSRYLTNFSKSFHAGENATALDDHEKAKIGKCVIRNLNVADVLPAVHEDSFIYQQSLTEMCDVEEPSGYSVDHSLRHSTRAHISSPLTHRTLDETSESSYAITAAGLSNPPVIPKQTGCLSPLVSSQKHLVDCERPSELPTDNISSLISESTPLEFLNSKTDRFPENGYGNDIRLSEKNRCLPESIEGEFGSERCEEELADAGTCAGCGDRLQDRYYLQAVDKQWHVNCLTCCDCHFRLDSELTCFVREGQIYCKEDYYRRFAVKRCSRCQLGISANELVMRARDHVFHLSCFSCSACSRTLTPGEEFGLRGCHLYCRTDYQLLFHMDYGPSLSQNLSHNSMQSPNGLSHKRCLSFFHGVVGTHKGRPRKRKNPSSDHGERCDALGLNGLDGSEHHGDILDREGYSHNHTRQKRVRTSFKHHQLRTMKSYFALNHNPDAKDLKQLAQKTGLSKRVLQVWFQNARAKYRRSLLKQQHSEIEKGVTTSPSITDIKDDCGDNGCENMGDDCNTRSPALSDISSSPSLSDINSNAVDSGDDQSLSSIADIFSSTVDTLH